MEYRPAEGNCPIVLTSPHGGTLRPDGLPVRTRGCMEPDTHSLELAQEIQAAFVEDGRWSPALVGMQLDRSVIDANRPRSECCDSERPDVEVVLSVWDAYHGWIEESVQSAVEKFGMCLLLDIHGQSHREGVSELGFLLTSEDLLLGDEKLSKCHLRPSSLDFLASQAKAAGVGEGLCSMVRGPMALGSLLDSLGFPCVPSQNQPVPVTPARLQLAGRLQADILGTHGVPETAAQGCVYFWGGYTTRRYSASKTLPDSSDPLSQHVQAGWASKTSAIQVEASWLNGRSNATERRRFAFGMRSAISEFLEAWWMGDPAHN